MFHVKHFLFILFLLPILVAAQAQFSLQDKKFSPSVEVDQQLLEYVKLQIKGRGLTQQEKQFFYWSNFLRLYPKRFYTDIIGAFLSSFPEAKGKESESLKKELLSLVPLSRYKFSIQLADLTLLKAALLRSYWISLELK